MKQIIAEAIVAITKKATITETVIATTAHLAMTSTGIATERIIMTAAILADQLIFIDQSQREIETMIKTAAGDATTTA